MMHLPLSREPSAERRAPGARSPLTFIALRPLPEVQVRLFVAVALAASLVAPTSARASQAQSSGGPSGPLHALLAEHLEWRLQEFPESATRRGDSRYNSRLTDL